MTAHDVLDPTLAAHIHGQQSEDHHGEWRNLKDGRRDGWENFLKIDTGHLERGEKECAEGRTYRSEERRVGKECRP